MLSRLLIAAVVATGGSGAAMAQAMPPPSAAATASPSAYVTAAGQSDQFEIQEGRLAQSKGQTAAVRQFGAKMIRDHTKSTEIVMKAAQKSGLPPMGPPPLRPDQQQMLSQLQSTPRADFDRTYVQQQLQAHKQALQMQQAYARSGSDPNLRKAASKIVPVVQQHLSILQSMPGGM